MCCVLVVVSNVKRYPRNRKSSDDLPVLGIRVTQRILRTLKRIGLIHESKTSLVNCSWQRPNKATVIIIHRSSFISKNNNKSQNAATMPSKRLRHILKKLEHPVSSHETTTTFSDPNCDTSENADQDNVLGNKVVDHWMDSSRILLQAIESRKFKRQRCTSIQQSQPQQQQTTTSTPATVHQTDADHSTFQSLISNNDTKNDDSNNNNNVINSVHELRKVYLYGLQTVSKLQDLRDAPDAILPGNFCDKEQLAHS